MKKKVAIQGIAGCYHDIAARNYYEGEEIEIIPCNTFPDVISTIKKDPSVVGLMAIENTIAGILIECIKNSVPKEMRTLQAGLRVV